MQVDFPFRTDYNSAELREVLEGKGISLTEDGWKQLNATFPREVVMKLAVDGLGMVHVLGAYGIS